MYTRRFKLIDYDYHGTIRQTVRFMTSIRYVHMEIVMGPTHKKDKAYDAMISY